MNNPVTAGGYMTGGGVGGCPQQQQQHSGFGGSSGGRFRRSTSYPGKNNVFGSTQFHLAPPTLEVTNIDENSDYSMYQVI
jgi:hypothetical protein